MRLLSVMHFLALILAALQIAVGAEPAGSEPTEPRVLWKQVLGDDELWYSLESMAASPYGEVLVAALGREDVVSGERIVNHPVVWRLDSAGQVLSEARLQKPRRGPDGRELATNLSENVLVSLLDDGDALVCVNFEEGQPWMQRVDTAGRPSMSRRLFDVPRQVMLRHMEPLADGTFMLLGFEGPHRIALRVDENGEVLDERLDRRTPLFSRYVGGTGLSDGGYVLLENTSRGPTTLPGLAAVWMRRFDSGGALIAEVALDGRQGSAVATAEDHVLLAYDAGQGQDCLIRLAHVTPALDIAWSLDLVQDRQLPVAFRAARAGEGGAFVAGGRELRPWVGRVGATGELDWELWLEELSPSPDYRVVTLDGTRAIVAASAFEPDTTGALRGKIRVLQVGP